MRTRAVLVGALAALVAFAARAQQTNRYEDAFKSAAVVWHMKDLKDAAGKNTLKVVGAVTMGTRLTGKERADSLAAGFV